MRKAEDQKNLVEIADMLPEEARDIKETKAEGRPKKRTNGAGVTEKSAAKGGRSGKTAGATASGTQKAGKSSQKSSGEPATAKDGEPVADNGSLSKAGTVKSGSKTKRAKAKQPTEKITPASILKKLIAFGKDYQIENEQDFREAARIYSEEAALIDQMRKRLKEDGLTVLKTYKTGDCEVAHPLLSELPRHVESANKCLMTISSMIEERGAKKQKPTRDLDQFRLHA